MSEQAEVIPCPECEGRGEHVVGWTPRTWEYPGHAVMGDCEGCKGKGVRRVVVVQD